MKTNIKLLSVPALCLALMLSASCDGFLTEHPQSQYIADNFYKSQQDFEYAIAGVYAAQQGIFSSTGGVIRLSVTRSDDLRVKDTEGYNDGNDRFIDGPSSPNIAEVYRVVYTMIYRANAIIESIDAVEFSDEALKNNIKGEALALRAWSYYTLGTWFGGVPLIDRTMTTAEIRRVARSTQEQTLDFAATDYKAAIDLLPYTWSDTGKGRITKYAAMGGLARLYMFVRNWATAQSYLDGIISSGAFELPEDYKDNFSDEHNNDARFGRLWEVQFMTGVAGEGNILGNSFLPDKVDTTVAGCKLPGSTAAFIVSTDLCDAFEPGDVRKDLSIKNGFRVGGIVSEEYYCVKWLHSTKKPLNHDGFGNNIPIIRYADVLLMYAECKNEMGDLTQNDLDKSLNLVRARAHLGPVSLSSTEANRNAIIRDRRVEFAFEGLRWWDLVRWGKAADVMNGFLNLAENKSGTYQMQPYRTIYAIPAQEIANYNDKTVMWQNEGY